MSGTYFLLNIRHYLQDLKAKRTNTLHRESLNTTGKSNISEQTSLRRQITYKPNSKKNKNTTGRYVFPPLTGESIGYNAMLLNITII